MADKTVDEILIEIEAPAQHAKDGLEAVKKSLTSIKNASKSIDVKGLEKIKNFLNGLKLSGDTGASMESTGKGIRSIATSIKTLSTIDSSKLKEITDSVSMVGQSLGNLGTNNKISIRIDSEGIKKAVQPLEQVKEATADMVSSIQAENNAIQSAAGNLTNLASLEDKISDRSLKASESSKELDMSLARITQNSSPTALKNLDMTLANFATQKPVSELQRLIDRINEYKRTIAGMESGKIEVNTDAYKNAVKGLSQATEELKKFKSELIGTEAAEKATERAAKKVDSAFGTIGKVFSERKKALSGMVNIAKSAAKGVGNLFGKTNTQLKKTTSMFDGLRKKFHTFARLYTFMALRKMLTKVFKDIGEAFNLLAQYSDNMGTKFNKNVSLLVADAKWLGRSIVAAFEPILNAVAPILDALVAKIVAVINAINQLISSITGLSTFTRAKKNVENYAAGLDKAGKAAKKLKKTVLGFDELNQLQDNKDSSGGGSSSVNPNDVFETADIDDKFKKWADWLKSMWAKGDFTELGSSIGNWLLNALNSIPWTKIKARAYKVGKSFATLLNGIFETPELGRTIGRTIAETINTAVLLANGFVRNFHWDSLGEFIGDTFNGFFENIDWYYIKDTFVAGMRGLAISIQNFIKTFNWDNISTTVTNALETAATGIRAFLENIDWEDLGTKFGTQLKKIITDTDWKEVGKAIGDVIQAAIDFVSNTFSQLKWEDIKKAIQDVLEGLFETADKDAIGDIIKTVLDASLLWAVGKVGIAAAKIAFTEKIKSMVTGAIASKTVSDAAAGALGETVTAAGAGETVATAAAGAGEAAGLSFIGGLTAALAGAAIGIALTEPIKRGIFNIGEAIAEASGNDKALEKLRNMHEAYKGMDGTLDMLKDGMKEFYEMLGGEVDRSIYTLTDDMGNVTRTVDDLGNTIIEFADHSDVLESSMGNLSVSVTRDLGEIDNSIHIADTKAAEAFRNMNKSASELRFEPAIEGLRQLDGNTTHAFDNIKSNSEVFSRTISQNTKAGFDAVKVNSKVVTIDVPQEVASAGLEMSGTVKELSANFDTGMANIRTTVDSSMRDVNNSLDTVRSGMTEDKWTFSGVWEGLGKTFENAKSAIKNVWNNIADTLNGNHSIGGGSFNINLPRFATGGMPEDGLFMANHNEILGKFSNGRTAVANNKMITDGIADAVYDAVSAAGGLGGDSDRPIYTTITLDGMVIARAVSKGQTALERRYSPTTA